MTQQGTESNPDHDRSKLGKILDPSLKIRGGSRLEQYLKTRKDLEIKSAKSLTIPQLKAILKAINEDRDKGLKPPEFSLTDLLAQRAEVLIPELEVPERDPKLEARINRLKFNQAEKEYQRMTQNVNLTRRHKPEDSIGSELKKMNQGLIAIFQFIITVGAGFLFGFLGIEVFFGYRFELAVRLLLGIVFALVVGAAELYFLVLNMDFGEKFDEVQAEKLKGSSASKVKKLN